VVRDHDQDDRQPAGADDDAAAPAGAAQVADQIERARVQVFEAYVRSRERARGLGRLDADED
jgi:hypothetical protein